MPALSRAISPRRGRAATQKAAAVSKCHGPGEADDPAALPKKYRNAIIDFEAPDGGRALPE